MNGLKKLNLRLHARGGMLFLERLTCKLTSNFEAGAQRATELLLAELVSCGL